MSWTPTVTFLRTEYYIKIRQYQSDYQKMDSTEKLATYGKTNEEKEIKNTTQYALDTTIYK